MCSLLKQLGGRYRLGCPPEIEAYKGIFRMLKLTDLVHNFRIGMRAKSRWSWETPFSLAVRVLD